jgi:hypothetical protein
MTDQNSPNDFTSPRCRKCRQPIEPRSEDEVLDQYRSFFRLRCTTAECGHIDWYRDVTFVPATSLADPKVEAPGEIWIHDVIMGTSFKSDGNASVG